MVSIKDSIQLQLTQKAIKLNTANKTALEKVITNRLEQAKLSNTSLADNKKLLNLIFKQIANEYKKLTIYYKSKLSNPNSSAQTEFKQFIREAIDQASVDFLLQKKFENNPRIILMIKEQCQTGWNFYVKNKLALLLAEHIEEWMSKKEIKASIEKAFRSHKVVTLIKSSKTLNQSQTISQEITQRILNKNQLHANHMLQNSKPIHQQMRVKDIKNFKNEENEEKFEQFTEFSAETSELIKLAGEMAEKSHHLHTMSHAAEATSKALTKTGGIGTLIAGILGAFSLPVLCAIERRRPSLPEVGMIGLSMVTIILGSLAIASVGGPIGVGAFVLAAAVIGLGKTLLNYYKDFRERRHLKKQIKKLAKQQNTVELELSEIKTKMSKLQIELEEKLNGAPNSIDHHAVKRLHKELNELNSHAKRLTHEFIRLNKDYAKISVKLTQLNTRHANVWHHAKTGIYISSGLLAITGAALMLFPATAPLGVGLMIAASALSLATMVGSFIAKRVNRYQAKKAQRKAAILEFLTSTAPETRTRLAPKLTNNQQLNNALGTCRQQSQKSQQLPKLIMQSPTSEARNEEQYIEIPNLINPPYRSAGLVH